MRRAPEPHFPLGGPVWGPQEVVGATILCLCHRCCWAGSSPQILRWKSSSLLQVHPKGGIGLGQQHPVGAKVGGSTHLLDGGVGVLMG